MLYKSKADIKSWPERTICEQSQGPARLFHDKRMEDVAGKC
jgi:hypothetical protein